jgi:hypothetical protein
MFNPSPEKEVCTPSSVGQSMSSREDLIEDKMMMQEDYAHNVTRFGSIQPKRNINKDSKKNILTQSTVNLQNKKVYKILTIYKSVFFEFF